MPRMGAEMNEREALKLALEALDCICSPLHVREIEKIGSAMKAIKEALAQPEQEPAAMRFDFDGYGWLYIDNGSGSNWREKIKNAEPLYTISPQRKPLTDELYNELLFAVSKKHQNETRHQTALRYILQAEENKEQAAHGIKE